MGAFSEFTRTNVAEVVEIRFALECAGDRVPGLAIMPRLEGGPYPVVLIQHPGTGSKDDYFVREVALQWALHGWICAGIDAPMHGDRDPYDPMSLFQHPEHFPAIRKQFAKEVSATVDAIGEELPADLSRLAYVGYSMGSMLGLEAVATDGRFNAAVFWLVGEGGLAGQVGGEDGVADGYAKVAVRIVGKAQDELVKRPATEALYEALPGTKDLVWLPGGHFQIGPDVVRSAEEWLKKYL